MDMGYREVPIATVPCPGCGGAVAHDSELCPRCGNPVDIGRFAELELKVKPDLRKARIFLGVLAGLQVAALGLALVSGRGGASAGYAITVAYFGACFVVAFWRPAGASLAAMALFLMSEASNVTHGHVERLFDGIVLKIVFLVLIGAGIRAGYRVRDLRGQWRPRDRTIGAVVLIGSVVLGALLGLAARRH